MTRFSLSFAVAVLLSLPLPAQQTPTGSSPRKILTSEQQAYQAARAQWFADHEQRLNAAQAILDRVPQQPTGGDCPKAMSTYDQVQCLGALDDKIAADESAFIAALRGIASHGAPSFPGEMPQPGVKTPQQETALLDSLESDWQTYRKTGQDAAHAQGGGGSISPILALYADLILLP